jgi:hypothetical protein
MEEIIKPRNKHAKIWAGSSLSHSWEWEGAHLPVVRRAVATPGTMGTGPCTIASLEGSIPTLSWTYLIYVQLLYQNFSAEVFFKLKKTLKSKKLSLLSKSTDEFWERAHYIFLP